jgi:hypothetical protein
MKPTMFAEIRVDLLVLLLFFPQLLFEQPPFVPITTINSVPVWTRSDVVPVCANSHVCLVCEI